MRDKSIYSQASQQAPAAKASYSIPLCDSIVNKMEVLTTRHKNAESEQGSKLQDDSINEL